MHVRREVCARVRRTIFFRLGRRNGTQCALARGYIGSAPEQSGLSVSRTQQSVDGHRHDDAAAPVPRPRLAQRPPHIQAVIRSEDEALLRTLRLPISSTFRALKA